MQSLANINKSVTDRPSYTRMDTHEKILLGFYLACGNSITSDTVPLDRAKEICIQLFFLEKKSIDQRVSNTVSKRPEWFEYYWGFTGDTDRRKKHLRITEEGHRVLDERLLCYFIREIYRAWFDKSGDIHEIQTITDRIKDIEYLKLSSVRLLIEKEQKFIIDSAMGFSKFLPNKISEEFDSMEDK